MPAIQSLAFFNRVRLQNNISGLAARAYVIILIQHVVIIFISANINMAELNAGPAVMFYVLVLITTERISVTLKTDVGKMRNFIVKFMLK